MGEVGKWLNEGIFKFYSSHYGCNPWCNQNNNKKLASVAGDQNTTERIKKIQQLKTRAERFIKECYSDGSHEN